MLDDTDEIRMSLIWRVYYFRTSAEGYTKLLPRNRPPSFAMKKYQLNVGSRRMLNEANQYHRDY